VKKILGAAALTAAALAALAAYGARRQEQEARRVSPEGS